MVTGLAGIAHGDPEDLVPGAIDRAECSNANEGDLDVCAGIDYHYEADSSEIMRERVGAGVDPNGPYPVDKDLEAKKFTHTITPHVQFGVYHDVFVTAALPIIITQARELHLDDGVARGMSSTVADGILPMQGFDARDPTSPPPGDLMWRGVTRHGLDTLNLGLGFAPMNQLHDDTKPTWKIGAEVKLAVGGVMKFDPTSPKSNTAVGYGVHQLRVWTSFDRKLGWAQPWVDLWWQVPLAAKSDSLFQDPGFGSTNVDLGQQAGVSFGMQVYAVDDVPNNNQITVDVGTRFIAHFEGRDYSEMWEPFALAGTGVLQLDSDPTDPAANPLNHPGITNIENYLETAARVALRAELGPHVNFAALGDFIWKSDHVITFADAGVDRDGSDKIEPATAEVNPLYNQQIDLVGHRYRSVHNFGFVLGIQGQVVF